MGFVIDPRHDCADGDNAGPDGGVVPVHQEARSSCCAAVLAEGGTPETGFSCTACGRACERVLGPHTAHWTCKCGQRRKQVVTVAEDSQG